MPIKAISHYNNRMAKYPVFLELKNRQAIIIGGGTVAARKAQSLLDCHTRVKIVAKDFSQNIRVLVHNNNPELINAKYSIKYLDGAAIVIVATNDHELNKQIFEDCRKLNILCNVVDKPELCDFFVPAVINRGDLQIAVGTNAACPAYAAILKKKLEKTFTEKHSQFLEELRKIRKIIIDKIPNPENRKELLKQLSEDKSFEYFIKKGPVEWNNGAMKIIDNTIPPK